MAMYKLSHNVCRKSPHQPCSSFTSARCSRCAGRGCSCARCSQGSRGGRDLPARCAGANIFISDWARSVSVRLSFKDYATFRKRAAEESRVESDSSPVEEQNFSPVGEQTSRLVTTGWQEEELLRHCEAVQGRPLEEREQGEPGHVTGQQDPVNYDHQLNRQEPQFHNLGRGSSPRPRMGVPMPDAPLNITLPSFFQQADLNWSSNLVKPWPLLHPFAGPSPPVAKLARIETSRAPHNFSTPENLAGSYRGIHQPFDFSLNNYKNLPQPQPAPKIKPDQASMGRPDGVFENRLFPEAEPRKRPSVIQKFGKVHLQYNEVSPILAKVPPGKKFDESGLGGPDQPVAAFVAKDEDPEDIRMINKYLHKKFGKCFTTR